jgi:cation diffusion facilitator family transporter
MQQRAQANFKFQKLVTIASIILLLAKLVAYYLTNSVAVLTDALESTVNVAAAAMGLYSLYYSAKPKDDNHPYGHGKIEFVTAGIEGGMILFAGCAIIYEAIATFRQPHTLHKLDWGLAIVAACAAINWLLGMYAIRQGKANSSLALVSSGKHLQSDAYTTMGIIVGIALIMITKIQAIDAIVAVVFALLIIATGYRIIREAMSGIMDEADKGLLAQIADALQQARKPSWVDIHNLRAVKNGSILHIDCHVTLPWYLNVLEAHEEVKHLEAAVQSVHGMAVEISAHTDACVPLQCSSCSLACALRKHAFDKQIVWNIDTMLQATKLHL